MAHRMAREGYRVLVCAPFGRDADSVADLLRNDGYDTVICRDLADIAAGIGDRVGTVLITEEALISDLGELRATLEEQSPWSDVPFILLKARRNGRTTHAPLYAQLLDLVRNTVVLERPLGKASLISAVSSAMRARQKQFEMRDRLNELATSESRLRLATAAANIGTWDFDPVRGTLRWDERCKAMFGLSPHASVTYEDSFLAGIHPDDRERANAAVMAALEPDGDGRYDIEYRTIGLEDGVERWITARGSAVFDDSRAIRFIGTVIDISARKQSEAALAASEAALREESLALEILNRTGERVRPERAASLRPA